MPAVMRPNTFEFSLPENPVQPNSTPSGPPPPVPVNVQPPPPPTNVVPPLQTKTPNPAPAPVSKPRALPDPNAARNALLDAIRNPKKAKKKQISKKVKPKKAKKPPPMDVMTALKNKLKRRANAQAGVQSRNLTPPPREQEEEDGFGITKLRAFRMAQNLSGSENEEDSNDDDWK